MLRKPLMVVFFRLRVSTPTVIISCDEKKQKNLRNLCNLWAYFFIIRVIRVIGGHLFIL